MVSADGERVCVCDFGLADTIRSSDSTLQTIAGTVSYMAPERIRCEKGDARSDQFSFCVALWEGLHRRMPYWGKTLEGLLMATENYDIQAGDPRADVPHWLSRIVRKGLHPDPDQRYPDMGALLSALTADPPAGDVSEGGVDDESDLFETPGYMHAPAGADTVEIDGDVVDVALRSRPAERARLVRMGAASLGGAVIGTVLGLGAFFGLQEPVPALRPQLKLDTLEAVSVKGEKLQLGMQKLAEANQVLNKKIVTEADTRQAYDLWLESQPLVTPTAPGFFASESLDLARRIDKLDPGRRRAAWIAAHAADKFRDAKDSTRAAEAACEAAGLAYAAGNEIMAAEQKSNAAMYNPDLLCEVPSASD